ncbi:stand still [Musca autumnalis]|uniref:stand still n=1 Tax=Musca autumnalis TaxID=221902 RepID=UPI003CF030AF
MDNIESEDTSNDTTMISELLKSAEVVQQQSQLMVATTSSSSSMAPNIDSCGVGGIMKDNENQEQQKKIPIPQQQQQSFHINSNSDGQNQQSTVELPPLTAIGHNASSSSSSSSNNILMLNHQAYSNIASVEDSNKLPQQQQFRHVHIPYILNGELYQIQTQDGENVTVKCCHCPPDRVYRGSVRSTGNFHMHIKRRHPDLLEKLHDMKVNALLERRDRLMRNRKITSRNNRNNRIHSPNMVMASTSILNKDEANKMKIHESNGLNSASELSMLHTHKLKIKTVFQRHQMQQREAAEMRNWNNMDYVVMPIAGGGGGGGGKFSATTTNEHCEEGPINYSLKATENNMQNHSNHTQQQQQQLQPSSNNPSTTTTNDINNNSISTDQQKQIEQQQIATNFVNQNSNNTNTNHEYVYGNLHNNYNNPTGGGGGGDSRNLSTAITTTNTPQSSPSPSVLSSFSSTLNNHQQFNMESIPSYQSYIHQADQQQTLSFIKPEHLLIPPPLTESQQAAIDLTLNTDSGIFSNNSSINVSQNSSHDARAGSLQNHSSPSNNGNNLHSAATAAGLMVGDTSSTIIAQKWQELLMHVETSLRDIQHEMNIRNQIESNRMFLDIAKFKFLNPGFQFNW